MNRNNPYEKSGLKNRLSESATLFVFIIISLLVSLIVMDVIIFPIAIFSIQNETLFTSVVKYLFWIIITVSLLYLVIKKIYSLKKDELPTRQIIRTIISKPLSSFLLALIIIIVSLILILLINFLLQKNFYLLYKLIN